MLKVNGQIVYETIKQEIKKIVQNSNFLCYDFMKVLMSSTQINPTDFEKKIIYVTTLEVLVNTNIKDTNIIVPSTNEKVIEYCETFLKEHTKFIPQIRKEKKQLSDKKKEIIEWLNHNHKNEYEKKIILMKRLSSASFNEYIIKNISKLLAVTTYIFIDDVKKKYHSLIIAYSFMKIISSSMENLLKDIVSANEYSMNYCLNFGISKAYDTYWKNKINFFIEAEHLGISVEYDEIKKMDSIVDSFVNSSKPEIYSLASSMTNCEC